MYLFLYFFLSIFVPLSSQPGQGSTARLGGQLVIILHTAPHYLVGPLAGVNVAIGNPFRRFPYAGPKPG